MSVPNMPPHPARATLAPAALPAPKIPGTAAVHRRDPEHDSRAEGKDVVGTFVGAVEQGLAWGQPTAQLEVDDSYISDSVLEAVVENWFCYTLLGISRHIVIKLVPSP